MNPLRPSYLDTPEIRKMEQAVQLYALQMSMFMNCAAGLALNTRISELEFKQGMDRLVGIFGVDIPPAPKPFFHRRSRK